MSERPEDGIDEAGPDGEIDDGHMGSVEKVDVATQCDIPRKPVSA